MLYDKPTDTKVHCTNDDVEVINFLIIIWNVLRAFEMLLRRLH